MNQDTMSTINLCSSYTKLFHSFMHGKGGQVFLPLLREKRCDVVALRSCQRDVTYQQNHVQNGGTETM